MAYVGAAERGLRDSADGDDAASRGELVGEHTSAEDLFARGRTVRGRGAGVRRNDVPEQDVVGEIELIEHAVDDRRRRFRRTGPRQLPLGSEGDAGNARSAVAGRLADEEDRRVGVCLEIGRKPRAPQRGVRSLPVEVRCLPDAGSRKPVDERAHRDPHSD